MQINFDLAFLCQWVLPIVIGAFIGNTLSIFTEQKNCDRDDSKDNIKVSKAIAIGFNLAMRRLPWLLLWLALFITIPFFWHSIY